MKFDGHSNNVLCLQRDAYKLVSGSVDKTARAWDVRKMECFAQLTHGGSVAAVAIDARHLYTGCGDSALRVWTVQSQA